MIFALHFKDQGFLKPASLPWEAPRVSRQVPRHRHDSHSSQMGDQRHPQHFAQSMPFTVLSSEVCLPFRYPCSDWWRQLEGGPSHCLYRISNTHKLSKQGVTNCSLSRALSDSMGCSTCSVISIPRQSF